MRPITDPEAIQAQYDPTQWATPHRGLDIAVLCTGPSVKTTWQDGRFSEFQLVVAINNVADKHTPGKRIRHHCQAHFDRFSTVRPTSPNRIPREMFASFEDSPYKKLGCNYTFPNTLWVLRHYFPETRILVYGNDRSAVAGLGSQSAVNTTKRWAKEREATALVDNWVSV